MEYKVYCSVVMVIIYTCFVVRSDVKCHFSADALVFAQTAGDVATESVQNYETHSRSSLHFCCSQSRPI